ncbi:MAG: class I SAM-dependent methyltransferase [Terriglobia bacterium]
MSENPCVLCGALAREVVFEVRVGEVEAGRRFRLVRCRFCQLVMTEPRVAGPELEAHYGGDYWGRARPDDLAWVRRDQRYRTAFLARFRRQGRLLDVGCGLGLFLLALDPQRWERYGLEAMPVPYQEAAGRLGADRIIRGELTGAPEASGLSREPFDVITFWDVLEHLANPRATLEKAFRLLRPGGLVLLSLPNFSSYQARRFREDWYALSLPHHFYHFTPATLTKLLAAAGFRLHTLEDRFGEENYHALKHSLLNRLKRRYGARAGRVRYYLLKPFLRPWEWLSRHLAGGSHLLVCAERPPTA